MPGDHEPHQQHEHPVTDPASEFSAPPPGAGDDAAADLPPLPRRAAPSPEDLAWLGSEYEPL